FFFGEAIGHQVFDCEGLINPRVWEFGLGLHLQPYLDLLYLFVGHSGGKNAAANMAKSLVGGLAGCVELPHCCETSIPIDDNTSAGDEEFISLAAFSQDRSDRNDGCGAFLGKAVQ